MSAYKAKVYKAEKAPPIEKVTSLVLWQNETLQCHSEPHNAEFTERGQTEGHIQTEEQGLLSSHVYLKLVEGYQVLY